jgi:formylglycine-generating enzyme
MAKKGLFISFAFLLIGISHSQTDYSQFIIKPQKKEGFLTRFFRQRSKHDPFNGSYAIIIAVGDYDKLQNLASPKEDAQKMKNFLLRSSEYDEVVVLQDDNASFKNIDHFMRVYFPRKMKEKGRYRFLFYFSGHGAQHKGAGNRTIGSLLLQKSTQELGDGESIHMNQIKVWSDQFRNANHMLFLFDCCFSGLAGETKSDTKEGDYNDRPDPLKLAEEKGYYMITAGSADEKSVADLTKWGGSLFTDAVIRGMAGEADKGRDGIVTTHELYSYVRPAVENETNHSQNPLMNNFGEYTDKGEYFFVYKELKLPSGQERKDLVTQETKGKISGGGHSKKTTTLGLSTMISPIDRAEMVYIPAGEFKMGCPDGGNDAKPVHKVDLHEFYIDRQEVTNAQYRKFVSATGHREPKGSGSVDGEWKEDFEPWKDSLFNRDNQPVVCVSWHDAMAYASWAGKRLPTEAEWEKAARGGLAGKKYSWGDSAPSAEGIHDANYRSEDDEADGYQYTAPVGSFAPNRYGLHDMIGNVFEWCFDEYQLGFYKRSSGKNPRAGDTSAAASTNYKSIDTNRVLRGGSWDSPSDSLGVAVRASEKPSTRLLFLGFRCVFPR